MILSFLVPLAQLAITASAPAVVESQQELVVKVVVSSPSLLPPTIEAPAFYGFNFVKTSYTTRTSQSGNTQRATFEHQYHLIAGAPGQYIIPSFTAKLDGETARSRSVSIVVRPFGASQASNVPRVTQTARLDTTRSVNIAVLGTPDTVYVGEQATYEIAVFIDDAALRQRGGRNPTFTPPDLRGTLSYEIPPTRAVIPARQIGDRIYRPHVYQRAIFPLVPGNHVVPSAMLDYALPARSSGGALRTRDENYSLRADSVVIVARALPAAGKPADFSGAVGSLRIDRSISNMALRVGEPVTFRAKITGAANIKLLPRPTLEIPWADVLLGGESVVVEVINGRVGGTKEFEWVVTPRIDGMQQIPSINYPFFNPATRTYAVASTRTENIEVLPGALVVASESTFNARPALAIRSRDRGPVPRSNAANIAFLAIAAVAPVPALAALLVRGLRRRRVRAAAAAENKTPVAPGMYKSARRDFLTALERRLNLPVGVAATEQDFRSALLRSGVSRQTCEETVQLVQQLDAAAFAPGKPGSGDSQLAAQAQACLRKIDAEAVRRKSRTALRSFVLLPAILFFPQLNEGRVLFDEGVKLYRAGDYFAAANRFLEVTQRSPRSVDAWTNLGAAAWESGDTAAAIVSWQRALRLDPLAADVRDNLVRFSPTQSNAGWIPPVPIDPVAYVALALWIAACALAFSRVVKNGRFPGLPASALAFLALVAGTVAFETHRRVHDRRIAVVTRSVMSRALPALESQPLTRLIPGELVRLSQAQREWTRVYLDSRPIGWVHNSNLLRIATE